eukprot:SAG22_NODE_1059_length_5764_cov_3.282966_5_plen_39_part_00
MLDYGFRIGSMQYPQNRIVVTTDGLPTNLGECYNELQF